MKKLPKKLFATKREITITIPKEFKPIFSISNIICFKKITRFSGRLKTLRNIRKYCPIFFKIVYIEDKSIYNL